MIFQEGCKKAYDKSHSLRPLKPTQNFSLYVKNVEEVKKMCWCHADWVHHHSWIVPCNCYCSLWSEMFASKVCCLKLLFEQKNHCMSTNQKLLNDTNYEPDIFKWTRNGDYVVMMLKPQF